MYIDLTNKTDTMGLNESTPYTQKPKKLPSAKGIVSDIVDKFSDRSKLYFIAFIFTLLGSIGTYIFGAVVFRFTASDRLAVVEAKVQENTAANEATQDLLKEIIYKQEEQEKRSDRFESKIDQIYQLISKQ